MTVVLRRTSLAVALFALATGASTKAVAQPPRPPAAPAAAEPPPADTAEEAKPLAGYDKGFFLRSADDMFLLKIGARVQLRFTYEGFEDESDKASFMIRRARLTLKGHAFTPDLTYKFQTAWDKGQSPVLKDFVFDYRLIEQVLHVRAGQYKKPFSRQYVNSSSKLELVDRAITDKAFRTGRDIGLTLHNNYEKSPTVEYAVGFYNGSGDKLVFSEPGKGSNVPDFFDPLLVARLGYNFGKLEGYSEADLEGGKPRFGIAANVQTRLNADQDDDAYIVVGGDYVVKLYGLATTAGIFADWAQTGTQYKDQEFQSIGAYAQLSYAIASMVVPVLRYARVMPEGGDNDTQEILGGVGVYPFGHSFYVQLDGGAIVSDDPVEPRTDAQIRSQIQLDF